MGSLLKTLFIFALLAFIALRLYLAKYATKADVFARERSYGIKMPLWMKELPKGTGEIKDTFAEGRAALTGELGELKTNAKAEFNIWLEDLKKEAQEKAKKEAKNWIDQQFSSGSTTRK